jgi:predicted ATPase
VVETRASENDRLIGREPELSLLREFLGSDAPAPTLVLTGIQGIGKTALWEAGVRLARERATHVLAARPCEAEAQLSLAALFDWLEGIDVAALDELSAPQRRALEAALLRAEPAGDTPEPISIAVAFLGALRSLAASRPLLLAVDDLQWLDAASAAVLTFAARRLKARESGSCCRDGPATPMRWSWR